MEYLRGNIELPNEKEEKKIFQRARGYVISEGELFKSGITIAKMASNAIFQYNVLVIDIDNTTLGLI